VKKTILSTVAVLAIGGLTACNADEGAMDRRYEDNARPIGYYSNENNDTNNEYERDAMNDKRNKGYGGNYSYDHDNDGPITEILDRQQEPGIDGVNDLDRGDLNYSGHLRDRDNRGAPSSYYNQYEGRLAERLADRVGQMDNVKDARVVVNDNDVLVAIDTNDRNDVNMQKKIKRLAKTMAEGRNVRVVTDENNFFRVQNIDNELRNGSAMDEVQADIEDLFENLDDVFTNNR
jgi:spore cortex protein